jgi:hypothetical protein
MKVTRYKHRLELTFYVTPALVWEWSYTNSTNKQKTYTVGIEFARWGFYMDLIFGGDKKS